MGYLSNIKFKNFRNFNESFFSFDKGCNIITGKNGTGKTNLLEGISLIEKGRGFRKEKIYNLINFNNKDQFFNIDSNYFHKELDYKIKISNSEKNSKKTFINDSVEKEISEHFNKIFSLIYFLPEMERLFMLNPSSRRNFIDRLIFNYNKKYNLLINNYKKVVNERQSLLKIFNYDKNWIQKLEEDIVNFGSEIYDCRLKQIYKINHTLENLKILDKSFSKFFLQINDPLLKEDKNIEEIKNLYLNKLSYNREKDLFLGGCSLGPHRSDIQGLNCSKKINLNQFSTGQQKTAILLIIIAQCINLIENLDSQPIVLLDEICSHLDEDNRELILYLINELKVQVFMSGTEENFFSFLSTKANYCNIT